MSREVTWNLPTTKINTDKSVVRTGVETAMAHELVGFDGSIDGGLRVFPGFLKIHDFDPANEAINPNTYNDKPFEVVRAVGATGQDVHPWAGTAHTKPSSYKVVQHFPVSFKIGANFQGYGFVYKVESGYGVTPGTNDNVTASIHIDYKIGEGSTVYTRELRRGVDPDAQMDVTVMGRFVFIFIEGSYPLLFYVREESTTLKFKAETITEVNPGGLGKPFSNVGAFTQLWQSVQTLDTSNYIKAQSNTDQFTTRLKLKDWSTEGNSSRADDIDLGDVLSDDNVITSLSVFVQQQAVLGTPGSQVDPFSDDYVGMEGTMGFRLYDESVDYPDYAGGAVPEGVDSVVPQTWTLTEVNWDLSSVTITSAQVRGTDFVVEGGWYLGGLVDSAEVQVDQIYLSVTYTAFEEVCVGGVASDTFPGPGGQPILLSSVKATATFGSVPVPADGQPGNAQVTISTTGPDGIGTGAGAGEYRGTPRPQANTDTRYYEGGDYAVSYLLEDSQTGRTSAISNFTPMKESDFSGGNDFLRIEVVYDADKYDTMVVFRSPRTQGIGTIATAALQMQEARITLADYPFSTVPTSPYERALFYFGLDDKELIFQEPYPDRPYFDEKVPPGGACMAYESTLLVSKIERPSDAGEEVRALGELRWSSLSEKSPEHFSPQSEYLPQTPSSEIIRFAKAGENVFGLGRDRNYRLRKESVYFKVDEMHEGFGVVGSRAACQFGQTVLIVTNSGAKIVSSDGSFEDVLGINHIILNQWNGYLNNLYCAFDPSMACLFIHNKDLKHTVVMWFNTGKITELVDSPWSSVETSFWPASPLEVFDKRDNPFRRRATFLHSHGSGTTGKYRLCVVDSLRQRTISGGADASTTGEARVTMLDIGTGDSRFAVSSIVDNMDGTASLTLTGGNMPQRPEGTMLYFLNGDAEGVGVEVLSVAGSVVTVDDAELVVDIAAAADRVCISPVKTRVIFSQAGLVREDNSSINNDFFTVRHIQALGCHFTDVVDSYEEVTAAADDGSYMGALYVGNEAEPIVREAPTAPSSGNRVAAIVNREGTYYVGFGGAEDYGAKYGYDGSVVFPAVETFVSDLDFRLIGVTVEGTIEETKRTRMPS